MKIEICVDEKAADLKISVTCKQLTPDVEKMIAVLRMMNHQLTAKKDNEIHLLDVGQIIYIESVDRKCFIYTSEEIYESEFRLYELEQQLEEYSFFRVSKSFLIQLRNVQSLKADIDRKIRVTMSNGEQIMASRQYAEKLKKRLNVFCLIFGSSAKEFSAMFALGNQGIPVKIVFQFLCVSVLIVGVRFLFFTDAVIKKMPIWLRTVCMLTSIVLIIAAFVAAFHWFPVDMWQSWAMFLICFGISFLGSYFVMATKEKMENKRMNEALQQLKTAICDAPEGRLK